MEFAIHGLPEEERVIATFHSLSQVAFYATETVDENRASFLAETILPPIEAPGGRRRALEKTPRNFDTF